MSSSWTDDCFASFKLVQSFNKLWIDPVIYLSKTTLCNLGEFEKFHHTHPRKL